MAELAPFSIWLYLFSMLSLAASLIVGPSRFRWIFFVLVLVSNLRLIFTDMEHPVVNYFLGATYVGGILTASDYILLTEVQKELRIVGQEQAIADASFYGRWKWGWRLWLSMRGIGWTHEPKVFRPRVPLGTTRLQFLARQAVSVVCHTFILDAASIYNRSSPAFLADGISLAARPWIWRLVDLFFFAVTGFAQMTILHNVVSMVSVGIGSSNPQDWVHPFGYWHDAYTLRRFWGRVWHQFVRRFTSNHGKYLAYKVLRLQPGSDASSYTQLFTAFALSSVLHTVADYKLIGRWNAGGSFFLFLSQPVAIFVEDKVIAVARRAGFENSTLFTRLIGFSWVTIWFLNVLPVWLDPMVRSRFMEIGLNMPVSIILGVWKGEWQQLDQ